MKCNFQGCSKTLSIVDESLACRCLGKDGHPQKFCTKHRMPEIHLCAVDYSSKINLKRKLESESVNPQKILKI